MLDLLSHQGFENKKNIGPSLPPGFEKTQNVGPALPPGFETSHSDSDSSSNASEHNVTSQPQSDSEDDAGDMIGPLPGTSTGTTEMSAAEEFEKRARKMKDKLLGKEAPEIEESASRETWMTELPDGMSKDFGLGPRTFRSKAPAEQDSSWTDTPSSKNKEKQEKGSKKRSAEKVPRSEKEIEIEKAIEKYNKKQRKESLMDMHTKKLKKKHKKDKDKPKERRAFSREDDLKVNKFDDAQKKSILKKAALLDTRFSHGNKKFI
ncbi:unnamed protein product [Owenia fusiformis]|uniref:DUF3752 domain-containing protein n=1 Tax=Owenia fusiformis TaxID=6347 RepID=A0A8S4NN34_OWEFU|nr:unnamed protein product [Owenia fusiformis]